MVAVECPLCDYVTQDLPSDIALHQLKMHDRHHHQGATGTTPVQEQTAVVSGPEFSRDEYPNEISLLMVEHPINEKQRYGNQVVRDIYAECGGKVRSLTLLTFIRDQRESRFQLEKRLPSLKDLKELYQTSKDGNWINVRKFCAEEFVVRHKCISRVRSSISWVEKKIEKLEKDICDLGERKSRVCMGDPKAHHQNELKFLDRLKQQRLESLSFLGAKRSIMEEKLRGVSKASESLAAPYDKAHKRKRGKENKLRKGTDAIKRVYKQAASALVAMKYKNEELLSSLSSKGTIFIIDSGELEPAAHLTHKKHLNGLRFLHEKGFFGEGTPLASSIFDRIKGLETVKERQEAAKNKMSSPKSSSSITFHEPTPPIFSSPPVKTKMSHSVSPAASLSVMSSPATSRSSVLLSPVSSVSLCCGSTSPFSVRSDECESIDTLGSPDSSVSDIFKPLKPVSKHPSSCLLDVCPPDTSPGGSIESGINDDIEGPGLINEKEKQMGSSRKLFIETSPEKESDVDFVNHGRLNIFDGIVLENRLMLFGSWVGSGIDPIIDGWEEWYPMSYPDDVEQDLDLGESDITPILELSDSDLEIVDTTPIPELSASDLEIVDTSYPCPLLDHLDSSDACNQSGESSSSSAAYLDSAKSFSEDQDVEVTVTKSVTKSKKNTKKQHTFTKEYFKFLSKKASSDKC